MQVKDLHTIEPQPRQTGVERRRHRVGNAAMIGGRQAHLGADGDVGRFEFLQDTAEVLFRFAIAVLHRGVEIVHAGIDRACNGAFLVGGIAAHHQSSDRAAAEAEHRELHSGAAKNPQLHRRPPWHADVMGADFVERIMAAATSATQGSKSCLGGSRPLIPRSPASPAV